MSNVKNRFNKIAVLECELENLHEPIEADQSYKSALVIFKYRHCVIGHSYRKVINGVVDIPAIEDIVSMFQDSLWNKFSGIEDNFDYQPFVSVVVCTHRREDDLKNCMESLRLIHYPNKEILIIDNAPADEKTKQAVLAFDGFRYIREPRKGLDIARNRGLREANGEIVAFTDDDARVDKYWLQNIVKNFKKPLVSVVTGITLPWELETDAQIIFEHTNASFNAGYLSKEFSLDNISPLAVGNVGAGVNMAIRKSHLKDIGYFDEALDGGTYTQSGGDHEFYYRVVKKGYKIIYDPDAFARHKHRREYDSLKKTVFGYGVGVFAWWTKAVLNEKEFSLLLSGTKWFFSYYVLNIYRSLIRKPGTLPFRLAIMELLGAVTGPFAYLKSVKQLKNSVNNIYSNNIQIESLHG